MDQKRTMAGQNNQFPILLAGPILRRSEPEQVCIWLACSRPTHIKATIFRYDDLKSNEEESRKKNANDNGKSEQEPIGVGTTRTLQFGEFLFIGLVKAKPIAQDDRNNYSDSTGKFNFPTDILLAYDIELSYPDSNNSEKDAKRSICLNDLGLLDGKNSIIYNNKNVNRKTGKDATDSIVMLPSFFLQGERKRDVNILHGSCPETTWKRKRLPSYSR